MPLGHPQPLRATHAAASVVKRAEVIALFPQPGHRADREPRGAEISSPRGQQVTFWSTRRRRRGADHAEGGNWGRRQPAWVAVLNRTKHVV